MAKDLFHDNCKKALEADGWLITHDPLRLKSGKVRVEIDLGAEKLIAAEKGEEKIAVEIKSFISPSPVNDFEDAYGQFMLYRRILQKSEPERKLFLAVPAAVFNTFFQRPLIQEIVDEEGISLMAFDPSTNIIIQWKK
ncbi:MAG: XisH family protein [Lewinellaceae bacterium]|nr:XisH family protein [Saprospiraceae bacterium]MCB9339543.1 XisH family protein [Lewinellaceae bacterium]